MDRDSSSKVLVGIGALGTLAMAMPFLLLYWGWAVAMLWAWFAVPLGAPPITAAEAGGAMLLFALLRAKASAKQTDGTALFIAAAVLPVFLVCVGFFYRAWFY